MWVCLLRGRFTWDKLRLRERERNYRLLLGLLSNWDKVLRGGPTRLARAFAVLPGCVFFTRFSDNLGGFCIFIFFAKLVVITNSDLEFWSSFGSFWLPAFSFLLFNFCKFCPFVTAIIQNFVSTNEGKEIVQLKEQNTKKKGKCFKLEIIYYIYFHERT